MRPRDAEPSHEQAPSAGGPLDTHTPGSEPKLSKHYKQGMVGRIDDALWKKLDRICLGIVEVASRKTISQAGEPLDKSALLLDGLMARYVTTASPQRRSMVSIQVPGDFVDLHGLPLGHLDHDVTTLTDVRLATFRHEDLLSIMEASAADARTLWQLTMVDAAIHRHWIYRNAQLRALATIADFLCEMEVRLQACGKVRDGRMPLPLHQADLAEVTGLSKVHVSRVCKELREAGLCTIRDGHAELHDPDGLQAIAKFDPRYLYPVEN